MSRAVKRQYNSTRRQQQAGETREQIIRAAHDLFAGKGYGRTTIAEIAERAGVAVETVYAAFHNKATLLHQAWFVTFRGDEVDVPLYDRAEMQAILAEPDLPTRIRQHAAFVTVSNRRMAPLYHALQDAAATEQAAADLLDEYRSRLVDVATKYAHAAAATGQLVVSEADCRDIVYATIDGALWQRLVAERGWSDERFTEWLGTLWESLLVESRNSARKYRGARQ
jgi:AcrR family transcriptional regulator